MTPHIIKPNRCHNKITRSKAVEPARPMGTQQFLISATYDRDSISGQDLNSLSLVLVEQHQLKRRSSPNGLLGNRFNRSKLHVY